jgi:hypothetical protein
LEESATQSKSRIKIYHRNKGVFEIQKDYIVKGKVAENIKTTIYLKTYLELMEDAIFFNDLDFISEMECYLLNSTFDANILIKELNKTKQKYLLTQCELVGLKKSKAYRLGKFILKPLSFLKNKIISHKK